MKKFIFSFVVMVATVFSANAQTQNNYAGSSKFFDNTSITLQGGVVTPFNDFFENGSTTPTVVLGIDKYVTPLLGFGIEGRTAIGTGDKYNPHTAFDAVNVSGLIKLNVVNFFDFDGTRKTFEPVIYTGLGWGHYTCSDVKDVSFGTHTTANRNFMTYRAGMEFNFNLGKTKAWGIVVNPSVVWGNICNGVLDKSHGNFELTAGVVYRFKTSNGTRSFVKARLYDQAEVDALNKTIKDLTDANSALNDKLAHQPRPTHAVKQIVEVVKENNFAVSFAKNSAVLDDNAKAILNTIPSGSTVDVSGSTSPEGSSKRNEVLAQERADAVKAYLESRGINVASSVGGEAGRKAFVTIRK